MTLAMHQWAALAIGLMLGVIVFMDWVPTPLNRNIQGMSVRERLPSTLIHSALGIVFGLANLFAIKWLMLVGAVWYSLMLLAAIRNWWLAYLAGVHWGEITPAIYTQHYAANLRLLPRFKNHPVIPDVQHMLIHLTVVVAVLLAWVAFGLT